MRLADDVIEDVLARVRAVCESFTEDMERVVDLQARAAWGGDEPYIPKSSRFERKDPEQLRREIDQALRAGESVTSTAPRLGVSRRTLYRVLRR